MAKNDHEKSSDEESYDSEDSGMQTDEDIVYKEILEEVDEIITKIENAPLKFFM